MGKDVYGIVTDRIIAALEKGTVPWRKTWTGAGLPSNFASERAYRGINVLSLWLEAEARGYSSNQWITYKQCTKAGGRIKKGEHGTPIVFWNWVRKEDTFVDAEGNERTATKSIPFVRYYTAFNTEQTEGLELPDTETKTFDSIEACEAVVADYEKCPTINHGGSRAYYRPSTDAVQMPNKETFDTPGAYYATLFHEMAHSTGHKSRLNRADFESYFSSENYSKEELVAEMGAAFLAAETGIDAGTVENSAAYIQNWLSVLRDDRKLIVHAGQAAQKATDFIHGKKYDN